MADDREIRHQVRDYYQEKLEQHGTTPAGVDWNGETSQELRFSQLLQVIDREQAFTLNDYGCGYGAMLDYMLETGLTPAHYNGIDLAQKMIESAVQRHHESVATFHTAGEFTSSADYTIASGIFNVRQDCSTAEWQAYVERCISHMDAVSVRGFAFNCLTSYSDAPFMRDYLYYGQPEYYFGLCKTNYSRNVALLHDYQLYEFTILVRK
jgi:SAM-dependent methyltransferase